MRSGWGVLLLVGALFAAASASTCTDKSKWAKVRGGGRSKCTKFRDKGYCNIPESCPKQKGLGKKCTKIRKKCIATCGHGSLWLGHVTRNLFNMSTCALDP